MRIENDRIVLAPAEVAWATASEIVITKLEQELPGGRIITSYHFYKHDGERLPRPPGSRRDDMIIKALCEGLDRAGAFIYPD